MMGDGDRDTYGAHDTDHNAQVVKDVLSSRGRSEGSDQNIQIKCSG